MASSNSEYVISIKTEIESFDENFPLKSEEKCDALDVGVSENEFQPELIKSEDVIDIVYRDVKSENNIQEVNGETYCGLCGGSFINTMDYLGVEDLKVICYCDNTESNTIHGEDVSQDLKVSLDSNSDLRDVLVDMFEDGIFHFGESYCGLCGGRFINTMDYLGVEDLKVICYCENNESKAIHGEDVSQNLKVLLDSNSGKHFSYSVFGNMPSARKGKNFLSGNEHEVVHAPEQVGKQYQNESTDLKSLQNRNTGKNLFQNSTPTKHFREKRNLRSRQKDHDEKKEVNSQICTRSSVKRSGVTNYLETHTEVKNQMQCNMGSESFVRGSVLKIYDHSVSQNHKMKYCKVHHAGEKPVQCTVYCTGKILFQCKICSKTFNRKDNLKRHDKIHIDKKLFQCTVCPESFYQSASLISHEKKHMRTFTKNNELSFQCKVCSKTFTRNHRLKCHELTHTREGQFHCRICSKTFARLCSLERHETTHTEEKLFQCNYCSKSFNKMENLNRHEKIHIEEKPFQCKMGYTHSGIRPYQCGICPKAFVREYHLKRHHKIHN